MRTLLLILLASGLSEAQVDLRHRVSFSGGVAWDVGGRVYQRDSGVSLGATYAARLRPWLEVETGLHSVLQPAPDIGTRFGTVDPDDRFLWLPFGVRFVWAARKRIEISGGGGGLHEWYRVSGPVTGFGPVSRSGWGGYCSAGVAVALDRRGRFWMGAVPRLMLGNPAYARDRWLLVTGEFSVRF